ncbi:cell wall hydrolase [Thermaerobacter sp. PB12/4term]|nr:cell wall hydrolase [Thermaerobacter sp. PB12/4term]
MLHTGYYGLTMAHPRVRPQVRTRACPAPRQILPAGVLAGVLLWSFSALASVHDVQARSSPPLVPRPALRAEVERQKLLEREAQEAARIEQRHKFALGRAIWQARREERARQERLARLRQQEEARRKEEARRREEAKRREQARRKAVAKAEKARSQPASRTGARAASASGEIQLDELELLARMVEIEAGNEPYEGKVAVAAVILNRVRSPRFPDSVRAVIFQPGQFPTAAEKLPRVRPGSSERRAAREALAGQDPSNGALYFYNPVRHPCEGDAARGDFFCSLKVTARIGNHVFAR